jgi:hypothetical protein
MIAALLLLTMAPVTAVDGERAFAAMAQTEGQWTAFRSFAAPHGLMFTPQVVNAQQWLADRKDPPVPVMWWPAQSWVSCDGTLAVNTGPWVRQGGKSVGYFTTIWERQKDGSWKWLLDHGDALAKPRPAGDEVKPRWAKCGTGRSRPEPSWHYLALEEGPDNGGGASADDSLRWKWQELADKSRRVSAEIWTGSGYETILDETVRGQ